MSLKSLNTTGSVYPHSSSRWLDIPLRRLLQNPYKILPPYVAPGQRAADLGCGTGFFTIPLAHIVGPAGRVIAVDVQAAMLGDLAERARHEDVEERIHLHLAQPDDLGLHRPVDFALAFWMVHETPDPAEFLRQVYNLLSPGGHFLMVEPRLHVGADEFESSVDLAIRAGLRVQSTPRVFFSRAVVFSR